MITENKRPAYFTVAFDLAGNVKIQQIQYRMVLDRDGVPDRELELHPPNLLHVAEPTPQDVIFPENLDGAIGEVAAGYAATIATLAAERDAHQARAAAAEARAADYAGQLAAIALAAPVPQEAVPAPADVP